MGDITVNVRSLTILRIIFLASLSGGFVFSLMPGKELMGVIPLGGAVVHFVVFFVLSALIDLSGWAGGTRGRVLLLVAYGALIEAAQYFVPYRNATLIDVGIDAAGIALYFLLARRFIYQPMCQIIDRLDRRAVAPGRKVEVKEKVR